ncbi:MAG: hypothetical protein KDJ52_12700 [Anaerolineae bacterium]|nr:hypothetical protein [Anaerolineae bacterium]
MTSEFQLKNSIMNETQPITTGFVSSSTQIASNQQAATNFSQALDNAQLTSSLKNEQRVPVSSKPPLNRWRSLNFLAAHSTPRINRPWLHPDLNRSAKISAIELQNIFDTVTQGSVVKNTTELQAITPPASINTSSMGLFTSTKPLSLVDYPRPPADNGQGVHWIPTVSQSPEVVDRFVNEAVSMGMKWVLFLNEGTDIGANDYLVKKLTKAGIEPIMRIYTPGLTPIKGDIKEMVQHYKNLGVDYFQIYNEPNLMVETGGQYPNVDHYLDLWTTAARQVIDAGGLPGFGALSPQGEMDDRSFLQQTLVGLKKRGLTHLLDRSWLSMHNYTGPRPLNDPDGFMRFRQYDAIIKALLGRSLPIIGTEGGTHITEHVSEEKQIDMVTNAYKYMREQREPYNFAYTYWILANGHDSAWDEHALIRPDGPTELAKALKKMASGAK